jgi:hypothetical protein
MICGSIEVRTNKGLMTLCTRGREEERREGCRCPEFVEKKE